MAATRAILTDPVDADSVRRWGLLSLQGALGLGLLVVLVGASVSPIAAILPALALMGAACAVWLFRRPVLNLSVLIAAFVVIADFEEGIQPGEVVYGLYYLAFLGHWFWTRLFVYEDSIADEPEAKALLIFLVGVNLSAAVTLLFGGSLRLLIGEWVSISFLALYFPVREIVTRYRNGVYWILGAVAWVAVFILVRNLINYERALHDAEYAWEILRGRAVTNTAVLLVPAVFSLVFLAQKSRLRWRLVSAVVFCAFLVGLILTQSRGYWVALAMSAMFLLIVVDWNARKRLFAIGILATVSLTIIAYIALGDLFVLAATGIINRISSIGSATTEDISLVNRWRESTVVLGQILKNPVLGYGLGVPYHFYDIQYIPPISTTKTFVHNGYLALWYKFGLWGLGLVLYFWSRMIIRGLQVYRSAIQPVYRSIGLAGSVFLAAIVLTAITSNPFSINDPIFMFAVLAGLIGGAHDRSLAAGSNLRPQDA